MAEDGNDATSAWQQFWDSADNPEHTPVVLETASLTEPVWAEVLPRLQQPVGLVAVELACGSRPVLADRDAVLIDASCAALQAQEGSRICADLLAIPLANDSASLVVSQFGLEYGGRAAFAEAARISAPGAQLAAVVHLAEGAIYRDSLANRAVIAAFVETRLLERCDAFFEAAFGFKSGAIDETRYLEIDREFSPVLAAAKQVLVEAQRAPAGKTVRFVINELGAIHARFDSYELAEIRAWTERWRAQLTHYLTRQQSMLDSALTAAQLEEYLTPWQPMFQEKPRAEVVRDAQGQAFAWLVLARIPTDGNT